MMPFLDAEAIARSSVPLPAGEILLMPAWSASHAGVKLAAIAPGNTVTRRCGSGLSGPRAASRFAGSLGGVAGGRHRGVRDVEDVATALRECGDVIMAIGEGALSAQRLVPIRDVVCGKAVLGDGPVLFKGSGMAWQDLVVAEALAAAYEEAPGGSRG